MTRYCTECKQEQKVNTISESSPCEPTGMEIDRYSTTTYYEVCDVCGEHFD